MNIIIENTIEQLATAILKWQDGPYEYDDHERGCEFRMGRPPMDEDCNCGAFRRWREKGEECAEKLANLILFGTSTFGLGTLPGEPLIERGKHEET